MILYFVVQKERIDKNIFTANIIQVKKLNLLRSYIGGSFVETDLSQSVKIHIPGIAER